MHTSVPSIELRPAASLNLGAAALKVFERVELAFKVARERHNLAGLDERMLKDIGLNSADVHRETSRAVWDTPRTRPNNDR